MRCYSKFCRYTADFHSCYKSQILSRGPIILDKKNRKVIYKNCKEKDLFIVYFASTKGPMVANGYDPMKAQSKAAMKAPNSVSN